MTITKVLVECEGDVNCFFTVFFEDGTKQKGWSCDQGSIEWDDGSIDPLYDIGYFCMELWFAMCPSLPPDDYEGRHTATWTPELGLSQVTKKAI